MKQPDDDLLVRLAEVLAEMQRIQARVAADVQPISMREVDALKRLGGEYAVLIARLAEQGRADAEPGAS